MDFCHKSKFIAENSALSLLSLKFFSFIFSKL